MAASPSPDNSQQADAAHVTLASLVAWHKFARTLPQFPQAIRATGGDAYLSPFRGRGMEHDESRPYQPGDDVRSLDWRVMARTGRPHTKVFREERERPVFCWVDYRKRMFFGTRGTFKHVQAANLAALTAWRAVLHSDRVGGLVFSDAEHHELKPARGRAAALHLFRKLEAAQDWPEHARNDGPVINSSLARLRRLARPGSLLVLCSDFRGLDATGESHIAYLARHNALLLFFIFDPVEARLPPPGRYPVTSAGHEWVMDTTDKRLVQAHQARHQKHLERLQDLCRRSRASFFPCSTEMLPQQVMQRALGDGRDR